MNSIKRWFLIFAKMPAVGISLIISTFLGFGAHDAAGATTPPLKVLVVSGGHAYDTAQFEAMWNSSPLLNCTFKVLPIGTEIFNDISAWNYNVLVFYNEQDPNSKFTDTQKANFLKLTDMGIGIIVMHHAVASYPFWPEYEALAGVKYTSKNFYPPGPDVSIAKLYVDMPSEVMDTLDPIMKGVPKTLTIRDEGYRNMTFFTDNHLLLQTSNHTDADGPLAWTRHFHNSKIFTTVLGHGQNKAGDPNIHAEPFFRSMMTAAAVWVASCATITQCETSIASAPGIPGRAAAPRSDVGYGWPWNDRRGLFIRGLANPNPAADAWDAAGRIQARQPLNNQM